MPDTAGLKQRIRSGEQLIGVSAPITSDKAGLERILEKDDYAFLSVDSQHSAFSEERLVSFSLAAQELRVPAILRIKHTRHTYLIGNLLDLGPSGVEVPQTESLETAEEAVSYFYYPQIGRRSWGGQVRVGVGERPDRLEYADWWNSTGVLWLQIESLNAITNARRLAMPGVDLLSWGPADLSFDREANPEHPLKTDDDCIRHVVKLLEGGPTHVCIRSYEPELRKKYFDMGATVLLERSQT